MKEKIKKTINILRLITFLLVMYSMVFQPAIQTFAFFVQGTHEFANYDWDIDIEEEKQEKDDIIETQTTKGVSYHSIRTKKLVLLCPQTSISDVHLEITIPPPELA